MLDALFQLGLFFTKTLIIVVMLLIFLSGIVAILSRGKEKLRGQIRIKNLNKKYTETTESLLHEILPKKQFNKYLKQQKTKNKEKPKTKTDVPEKKLYVLNFIGDIKASAVTALRKEVTAILGIATSHDEVLVCVESAGGMVHSYGLAAAQLSRIREHGIPLTVAVDKVAASGGYLMASVANKILAAPFAIIGSIGVIVQLPNFHRFLNEHHIDFEQLTAGNYKRTLTLFGKNTEEGREKLHEEIEEIHRLFKNLIQQYRHHIDIDKVATGEHWLGTQALELGLVDKLKTSDDYLLEQSKKHSVFEVCYQQKKSLSDKLSSSLSALKTYLFMR